MIDRTLKMATLATLGLAATVLLTSCEGKGRRGRFWPRRKSCLDAVPQSDPGRADQCLPLVQGYSSTEANVLKCSIYMTSGGLVESKIVTAYNALKKTSNTTKEATFMSALALNVPDIDAAYQKAITGNGFCKATGSRGLIYIGAAVVAGTLLMKTAQSLGTAVDVNDPASVEAAVKDLLHQCTSALPPAACTTDATTLGSTTIALADAYCGTSSADQAVCGKINSAVSSAQGNDARVGKALLCYLNQKTYSPSTNACI